MERNREREEAAARRREEQAERAAPPSVVGDVEDAVAEEVGGELTPWQSEQSDREPESTPREGSTE